MKLFEYTVPEDGALCAEVAWLERVVDRMRL